MFGATGDLAKRKLLPGLFHLASAGLLPRRYRIIGSAPAAYAMTDAQFRAHARDAVRQFGRVKPTGEAWKSFAGLLSFATADDDDAAPLLTAVAKAEAEIGRQPRRLHHLAIPPVAFSSMVRLLGRTGLADRARVIIEKPFGTDLASAQALNATVHAGVRRVAGLPHRPLPGEGVGRQHPRPPVRQRPVRAHLEPGPHPLRADRRPGEPHHRGPGRVLRGHGRVPGHGGHAPVPGARVRRHGAADVAGRQAAAGREDQGVRVPAAARRAPRRARSVPGVPQGAGRPSAVRHRDLRGAEGRGRQLAVGRGAVLPPHGQGAGGPTIGHHARAAGADAADVPLGRGVASAAPTGTATSW